MEQPNYVSLPFMRIQLHGQIVKTEGSSARLEITIGGVQKTIDWPEDKSVAEQFSTTIDAAVPGGELPVPFPVSAVVSVKKPAGSGAVLVSLDKIDVKIGQQRVATIQH